MIKIKYWSLVALSTLLAACSNNDFRADSDSQGRISLQLALDTQPIGGSRANLADLDEEDLTIRMIPTSGPAQEWLGVSEFEKEELFPIGNYTLEAVYGSEADQGFGKPYVYGSAEISVRHGETTQAALDAKLANSIVSATFSEKVKKFFTEYKLNIDAVEYLPEHDGMECYVVPGDVQIGFDYKIGADENHGTIAEFKAEPQHHYRIAVDINGGEINDAVLKLTFDDTMTDFEVEIPLENLTVPAEPALSATGFTSGEALPVVAGVDRLDDLYCGVIARGGVKSLRLTTEGANLIGPTWPKEIDLATATDAQLNTLKGMGLVTRGIADGSNAAVVDFREMIAKLPDASEGDIKITVAATDKYDQPCGEPVTLALSVSAFKLELSGAPAEVWEGEDAFTMDLAYNGGDPAANLQVQSMNERGIYEKVPATFTPGTDAGTYTVNVAPTQSWGRDITVRIAETNRKNSSSNESEIKYIKLPIISVVDANIWAKKAYVTVQDGNNPSIYYDNAEIACSTDGSNYNQTLKPTGENHLMLIEGLTPGQAYSLTARNPKDATKPNLKAVSFTTEEALQIPGSGFDNWTSEKKGDYQYLWSTESPWSTMNALTTSQSGSGSGSAGRTGGASYKATSGTIPANSRSTHSTSNGGGAGTTKHGDGNTQGNANLHSDKQKSGTNAALIRTVGWGKDNTAVAAVIFGAKDNAGFAKCDNVTVGELYLGKYENDPVYGYDFSSRPASLSFYYHYDVVSAGNGDYGTAEIKVYDKDGVEIASANKNLTEKSNYDDPVTMDLAYTDLTKKAAKISIVFKSSGNASALAKDTKYWRTPGSNNTSGGEYVGSELYIDDVQLNY